MQHEGNDGSEMMGGGSVLCSLPFTCLKSGSGDGAAAIEFCVFTVEGAAHSGLKYSSTGCDSW